MKRTFAEAELLDRAWVASVPSRQFGKATHLILRPKGSTTMDGANVTARSALLALLEPDFDELTPPA
jgi:hypothetical protein